MKTKIILTAMAIFATASATAADLKIGVSADYPPWESVDASGEIIGFDRDVGDEVCVRIAANCEWTNQAYDGLLPSLQVGKFDIVISGISITEARAEKVDFSIAYADAPMSMVVLAGNEIAALQTLGELETALAGKVIGVQTGSTQEQVVRAHYANAELRVYDRPEQVVDDLVAERLDAAMMERSAWEPFMEERGDALAYAGPLMTSADYAEIGHGQGIALHKGQEDLQAEIDAAIADMLADGTMVTLSNKWFGYDITAK